MINLPSVLSRLTNAVSAEPSGATSQHMTIHDVALYCWELDEELDQLVTDPADGPTAVTQPERFTRLLLDRLRAEEALNALLTNPCCPSAEDAEGGGLDSAEQSESDATQPATLVDVCLEAFRDAGLPATMSSADLVSRLRERPGMAGGRWLYAELTPLRLSRILAPYGVRPRTIRFPEQQLKGYFRSAFTAAGLPVGAP